MGCGSCSTGACGSTVVAPKGCKSNGYCISGGCNKRNSFDWLGNMSLPKSQRFNVVEVKFKGGRKDFFRNEEMLDLTTGDPVVVEINRGYHIGYVSLQGELVRLQMKKKNTLNNNKIRKIYRVAHRNDLEKFEELQQKDLPTLHTARSIIKEMKLVMKLSEVEFQADGKRATFYYSADDRVDFRELVYVLASKFMTRIEMRQISLREEASRIGGIGSCGRELCCSTWLTNFKSVNASAARYQDLSLNVARIYGQCGRLKCCLNYELETYLDALIDIPKIGVPLQLENGVAVLQKVDIFKKILWFSLKNDSNWQPVGVERVKKVLALNKKGIKASSLVENIETERTGIGKRKENKGNKKHLQASTSDKSSKKKLRKPVKQTTHSGKTKKGTQRLIQQKRRLYDLSKKHRGKDESKL